MTTENNLYRMARLHPQNLHEVKDAWLSGEYGGQHLTTAMDMKKAQLLARHIKQVGAGHTRKAAATMELMDLLHDIQDMAKLYAKSDKNWDE